jgi:hypothetical protein
MIDTGYNDDPREMLKLMQRVHEEHRSVWCGCPEDSWRHETGPETVRLLTRQEAWEVGPQWADGMRSFNYAHGMSCERCGVSFGKWVASYGPPPDDPDAPVSEYVCYAD